MLTAIVVGVATLSLGLALIVRIREAYGTIEADDVRQIDLETAIAQEAEAAKDLKEATA
jgi:multicomponent Na+:H+ antiporter subunit C